jgi:hypothetical protein
MPHKAFSFNYITQDRLRGAVSFYANGSSHTTSNIYHISTEASTKQLPPIIVKFNMKIGRLRILNNARSMKYSKQVVFDTMLLLLFQKSVIDIDDD